MNHCLFNECFPGIRRKISEGVPVCMLSLSHGGLYDPIDCIPPGSSVHGILQARILEWVAISSSMGSSRPRDRTHVFCIGRQILYHWATREAPDLILHTIYPSGMYYIDACDIYLYVVSRIPVLHGIPCLMFLRLDGDGKGNRVL